MTLFLNELMIKRIREVLVDNRETMDLPRTLEDLYNFAVVYGVSLDYLLGRSDVYSL